jgi:hypothetical protein
MKVESHHRVSQTSPKKESIAVAGVNFYPEMASESEHCKFDCRDEEEADSLENFKEDGA